MPNSSQLREFLENLHEENIIQGLKFLVSEINMKSLL